LIFAQQLLNFELRLKRDLTLTYVKYRQITCSKVLVDKTWFLKSTGGPAASHDFQSLRQCIGKKRCLGVALRCKLCGGQQL